jgi:hypothetical protein
MPAPSYVSDRTGPAWLKGALDAPFFTACPEHSTGGFSHKTDRNFYCLDCHEDALCTFCVDRSHRGHDILQIRRASHNNAVRVNEIHQVNAEGVQQYTINGSKILFLKGRRPPQPWRGGYHFCKLSAALTCLKQLSLNFGNSPPSEDNEEEIKAESICSMHVSAVTIVMALWHFKAFARLKMSFSD